MSNNNTNAVVKRIAVKAYCEFATPALIGSGLKEYTDNDILRDKDDNAFLPGSTVAGVLRSLDADVEGLFGELDHISPLWVFNAELTDCDGKPAKIVTLDGVAIGHENKVALDKRKYDYEAVETGTKFTLRLLLIIREQDCNSNYEEKMKKLIGTLLSGHVAFGAKSRRGFGEIKCNSVVKREFELNLGNTTALEHWLSFEWDKQPEQWIDTYGEGYFGGKATIIANLKLNGSIMIRDTRNIFGDSSSQADAIDYMHMTSAGMPVIFGTSWAGAFRSYLYRSLELICPGKAHKYLELVFGYVDEKKERNSASQVEFGASFLKESDPLVDGYRNITRVKIDRFTGGAANGALFTEKPWYGGYTKLAIRYPAAQEDIRELLLLGLDALSNGLIQIGGETSVGRGFFEVTDVTESGHPVRITGPKLKLKGALESISADEAGDEV